MSGKPILPTIITTIEGAENENPEELAGSGAAAGTTSQTHQRNTSVASTAFRAGHSRNTSLQVPGTVDAIEVASPSSPTLSATSDFSSSETGAGGSPPHHTSILLRENDPTKKHGHLRQPSFASAFTDTSGDLTLKTSQHHHDFEQADHTSSSPVTVMSDNRESESPKRNGEQDEKNAVSQKAEQVVEENASGWKKFKANLKGHTRQGRVAAQAKALEDERTKMRNIDPTPFVFKPMELGDLVDPKSVSRLREMGGVKRLLASLGTDPNRGLPMDALGNGKDVETVEPDQKRPEGWVSASSEDRKRVYGQNVLPVKKSKSLLLLMWLALQDKILILLCVAAVVSLALGLYTDFVAPPEHIACENPPPGETECELPAVDWVEGLAILVAVAIVDIVGSLNDWQKERQFKILNAKKEERDVKVIRQGAPMLMSVHNVQVGDILQLEPGEIIPCDGIFLRGHNVKCDESGATGESDMIRKLSYEECLEDLERAEKTGSKVPNRDCFLISGSRCLEGMGEYCVIAVGPTSFNGKVSS